MEPYEQLYQQVKKEFPDMPKREAILLVYSRWHELDSEPDSLKTISIKEIK